jgi:hypothetical protein
MAKQPSKPRKKPAKKPPQKPIEIPPGATRKAFDRPLEPGGGSPGSGGGPRHAADEEKGPPYAGPSGGAVGGTPAQLRSAEGEVKHGPEPEPKEEDSGPLHQPIEAKREAGMMGLIGFEAIEYAEKQGSTLNKHPDSLTGPRTGLTVAEAEAIAEEDDDLIWLDVDKDDYYSGQPTDYEPER